MTDWGTTVNDAAEFAEAALIVIDLEKVQNQYNVIATKYYSHYEVQRRFYYTTFQTQGEAPFAFEQFGVTFYIPDYLGTYHNDYLPPGAWYLFNPQLDNRKNALGSNTVNGYWQRYASRYSPPGSITLDMSSFAMDLASMYDDWNSYMNRYEEHKRDVLNERRWASQIGALQIGIKEAYAVERGLATSFDVFDKAQGQLVSSLNTVGNGLATYAGYRRMQEALQNDLGTDPVGSTNFFLR